MGDKFTPEERQKIEEDEAAEQARFVQVAQEKLRKREQDAREGNK
jgi:hypothetical protein